VEVTVVAEAVAAVVVVVEEAVLSTHPVRPTLLLPFSCPKYSAPLVSNPI
jgi:hypothetical protein